MNFVKVGSDFDCYCGKCKLELAHVVIAMDGAHPVRVTCKTCHSVHGYKKKAPQRVKRPSTLKDKKRATVSATKLDFETVLRGKNVAASKAYCTTESFVVDEVVNHTIFGYGVIVEILAERKIEVLFETGSKVLIHQR